MNQNEQVSNSKQSEILHTKHSDQQEKPTQQKQTDMKISPDRDFTTLEQVSNVAIVGLINQLSSLSCQSEHLFNELYHQCEQFNERTNLLAKRVTSLRNIVDKFDCKKVEPSKYAFVFFRVFLFSVFCFFILFSPLICMFCTRTAHLPVVRSPAREI